MFNAKSVVTLFVATTALLLAGCAHDGNSVGEAAAEAVSLVQYQCESGARIQASYPANNVAVVRYQGETHQMAVTRSASGARYTSDQLEWWTKGSGAGSEGTLFTHNADGTSGDIVERCKAVNSAG